jgi:hypothetical protein
MTEMQRLCVSGTFNDAWKQSIPALSWQDSSMACRSSCRPAAGKSHLQVTSTQGSFRLEQASNICGQVSKVCSADSGNAAVLQEVLFLD